MLAKRKNTYLIGKSYIFENKVQCCIFSKETVKQETKKILSAEEIKKEGKKRDQKAGKTRDL